MGQLQDVESQLIELGFQIVAVSPDRPEKVAQLQNNKDYDYTLLSDSDMIASRAFGLAWKFDDAMATRYYKDYGIDLEDASGQSHHLLPVPAVYVVDKDGVVRFQYVNPNYKIRIDAETLLAAARAVMR